MRNLFALIGVSMTMAFSVGGCAVAGDGDTASMDQKKAEATSEATDEAAFVDETAEQTAVKDEIDAPLTVKGAWEEARPKGQIFHQLVSVPQGQTLTCSTGSGSAGVDTVLAIVRFHTDYTTGGNVYNTASWPCQGGNCNDVYGMHTLAFNDDIGDGSLYSRVSYTSGDYPSSNVYVVGFGYGYSVGTATVTCNIGGTTANASFNAGSNQRACDQGKIQFTNAGWDTSLLAVDPNVGGGDTRMNEDISGSNYLSLIPNLPGGALWYVHGMWSENGGDYSNLRCAP